MTENTYMTPGEAALLAIDLYGSELDLTGHPTVLHAQWVGQSCSEQAQVAGYLHDVVEDGLITLAELVGEHRMSPTDYGAMLLLTHNPSILYRAYIHSIGEALGLQGTVAREVKSWDLTHNRTRPIPDELHEMRLPAGRWSRASRTIRAAQVHHGELVTGFPDREIAKLTGIDPRAFEHATQ